MIKFLLTLCLVLATNLSFAVENDAIDFMAEKIVNDFQKGVDDYNANKKENLPKIEKEIGGYSFTIKKNIIRFSIVNYLNKQLYINDELIPFSKIMKPKETPKTSFLDFLFTPAFAIDFSPMPYVDAESSMIMLEVLSQFSEKLEKTAVNCTNDSCKQEVKENNLKLISYELFKRKRDCKQKLEKTSHSIRVYEYSLQDEEKRQQALVSVVSPEFKDVREFMAMIVISNRPTAKEFMKNYMNAESTYGKSCMEVLLPVGLNIKDFPKITNPTPEIENAVYIARSSCIALEELKSCLINLQTDAKKINDLKRDKKSPLDDLPDVNSAFKNKIIPK